MTQPCRCPPNSCAKCPSPHLHPPTHTNAHLSSPPRLFSATLHLHVTGHGTSHAPRMPSSVHRGLGPEPCTPLITPWNASLSESWTELQVQGKAEGTEKGVLTAVGSVPHYSSSSPSDISLNKSRDTAGCVPTHFLLYKTMVWRTA